VNKAVRNERLKISATYVNGIAIAVMAIGCFAPVISVAQSGQVALGPFGLAAICFTGSVILHWVARMLLGGMEE
jgi:hypothetical protein